MKYLNLNRTSESIVFMDLAKFGYKDFLSLDVTASLMIALCSCYSFFSDNTSILLIHRVSSSFILSEVVDLPKTTSLAKLRAKVGRRLVMRYTIPIKLQVALYSTTHHLTVNTFINSGHNSKSLNFNKPERTSSFEVVQIFVFGDITLRF